MAESFLHVRCPALKAEFVIYSRRPTEEEQRDLERMTRQAIGRVSQRARMILLSAQGLSVPKLATLFGMSRTTIRHWIQQFNTKGPQGLYGKPHDNRAAQGEKYICS